MYCKLLPFSILLLAAPALAQGPILSSTGGAFGFASRSYGFTIN
jgi:hypothetical protein